MLPGLAVSPARAADLEQQIGWGALFNTLRFSEHWGMSNDLQFRSSDDWDELQTLLIRPGLTYHFDNRRNLTLGYAWIGTLDRPTGDLVEHRFWQQYVHNQSLGRGNLAHRFRLEQRFVGLPTGDRTFSQRLRYFARAVIPLPGVASPFKRGPFLALQNEVFVTLKQGRNTNGRLFDQNRAYIATGYRFSSKLDLEVGYLNQYIDGRTRTTENHIVQLAIYARY